MRMPARGYGNGRNIASHGYGVGIAVIIIVFIQKSGFALIQDFKNYLVTINDNQTY